MFGKIRTAVASAALAIAVTTGGLTALPAAAQADGLYFSFGQSHPHVIEHRRHRRHFRRHHRRAHRTCTPRHAIRKAARLGIRRAHVVRANRNVIRVRGHRHHRRVGIVFARAPGCPVVR